MFDFRDAFLRDEFDIDFYDYQRRPSNAILRRIFLREGGRLAIEFSRQSGKTTMLVLTIVFLAIHVFAIGKYFQYPFRTVARRKVFTMIIFAPAFDQAKTDFSAIKTCLEHLRIKFREEVCVDARYQIEEEESNANTLVLENGVTIHIFSLSENSHPESKTGDVLFCEESQHVLDHRYENVAQPMGVATKATEIMVGTAGYARCIFMESITAADLERREVYIADVEAVMHDKKQRYEEDGNPFHLNYVEKYQEILEDLGQDSDTIKTQYQLVWVIGSGMFFSSEQEILKLTGEYDEVHDTDEPTWLFIDWAKDVSKTVATFADRDLHILSWLELHGEKYDEQWTHIDRKCQNYNIIAIGMDSTGTQDQNLDWISSRIKEDNQKREKKLPLPQGIDFTLKNKDIMYRKLWYLAHDTVVNDRVTKASQVRIPRTESPERRRFIYEFLYLTKEIKQGKYWDCRKPATSSKYGSGQKHGDDYCDSCAGVVTLILSLIEFHYHENVWADMPLTAQPVKLFPSKRRI